MSEERRGRTSLLGVVLDGSYRIDGLLGEGGMGTVYQATQLRLDKPVAVKVMALDLASNQEAVDRFRREARVTSALGHPHIVQVFDFSTTPDGEPYLVMELLEGEDLERRLLRFKRLPLKDVVRIVTQVASALAATHAKGIVHRDLKPGNIYLLEAAGEKGFVKVVDFGISKVLSATTRLTRASAVMGTPDYMSPEQALGNTEDIDETTDQWALACIAWECLAGQRPFMAENVPSLLFKIVHRPPSSLLPKVPGLPRQVEDVLVRALAKDKADRFANVSDLAEALQAAATGTAAVVSPTLSGKTLRVEDSGAAAPSQPKSAASSRTPGEVGEVAGISDDTLLDKPPSSLPPDVARPPKQEGVPVRMPAKDEADGLTSLPGQEAAATGTPAEVSSRPLERTLPLPNSVAVEPAPPKTTTFSRTAGEVGEATLLDRLPKMSKWMLPAVGAAALVVVGGLLLFRSGPSGTTGAVPSSALPPASKPSPAPLLGAPPAPTMEMPVAPAMPGAPEPSPAAEAMPEPTPVVAAPVPAPPSASAAAGTRKPQRTAEPRKGGAKDSVAPPPAARLPAISASEDPFERAHTRKVSAVPSQARSRTIGPPVNPTGLPPSKPVKPGPQRQIIKEL